MIRKQLSGTGRTVNWEGNLGYLEIPLLKKEDKKLVRSFRTSQSIHVRAN